MEELPNESNVEVSIMSENGRLQFTLNAQHGSSVGEVLVQATQLLQNVMNEDEGNDPVVMEPRNFYLCSENGALDENAFISDYFVDLNQPLVLTLHCNKASVKKMEFAPKVHAFFSFHLFLFLSLFSHT